MILSTKDILGSGAYADVFRPPDSVIVYKLFVNDQHPTNVGQGPTSPEDEERRRRTFVSECQAYKRAAQHPFLRNHIPQYFRRCLVADVTDSVGSVAHRYMLALCYVMEYIEGVERKFGELRLDYRCDHIEEALEAFREAGIDHVIDSSIFSPDDPDKFIFIDFAMEEFQTFR